MQPRMLIALVALGVLSLAGATFAVLAAPRSPDTQASQSAFAGALFPPGVRAPDFSLHDQAGRPVAMREFSGRPLLVTFLYTHCRDSCPAEAQQIKGAFDDLGHDIPAVAISVDPGRDSRREARRFLTAQGMNERIRFALGSRRQLAPLWHAYAIRPQTKNSEHMSIIVLVDRDGFERVSFPESQTTPERLVHDLRLLGA
ncbi:MAG: hypothetical protein NVSMB25_04890 [Thermoleophilaceae bacterium]